MSIIRKLGLSASGDRLAPRPFRYAVLEHSSGERTFAKTYPAYLSQEFDRGRAIREVGIGTGIFRAPAPLEIFHAGHIILWEYLDGLTEMRDYVVERRKHPDGARECRKLFFKSGRALAAIHEGLRAVTRDVEVSPLPEIRTGSDALDRHIAAEMSTCARRPLHWDYCCGNLFVARGDASCSLVVLDAMPNHYVLQEQGPDVVCPVYVDLGQMIFSVCCHARFSRAIGQEADRYVSEFLAGYSEQSETVVDHATAFACAGVIARLYEERYRRKATERLSLRSMRDGRFIAAGAGRLFDAGLKSLSQRRPARIVAASGEVAR